MRKQYFFTIAFLLVTLFSQAQMLADFETEATSPAFHAEGSTAIVDNPDKTGINPSDKVGYYEKISGNWHYVTMEFPDSMSIGYNNTLTFKLRASIQGRIFSKFWIGDDILIESWSPEWSFQPLADTWTECKMDLTPAMGKKFTKLELAACVDNEEAAEVYFDDLELRNPELGSGEPKVIFSVSDNSVNVGESVTFDASESYDYDGEIISYDWDFGDGQTAQGVTVEHAFQTDSIFNVKLTLTDNDGKTSTGSTFVFVLSETEKLSKLTFVTQQAKTNQKIEAIFQVNANYTSVYNPDEVAIDATITCPDGKSFSIPAFYYVKERMENTSWVTDESYQAWMIRFISEQTGTHHVQLTLTDAEGTISSANFELEVSAGNAKGIIRNDAENNQYYRHYTGEPFYPLGINIGWNSIANYTTTINNLTEGKANIFRYWHTPFAQQALEWKKNGFYDGLGIYSQKAAAMSDSLINLCEANDFYMQLAIFQHGMFSENVDAMWEDSPYNTVNGGYVDRAEEYFYNDDCKAQTKKLLRYIVARWGYSTHLFAWEFFNEVQFTGIHNSQTSAWYPGVLSWHKEMSDYVASIDPFNHIQTTSAAHDQLYDMDTVPELDVVQYHLYSSRLLDEQIELDFRFRKDLQHTSIINGEYGTNVEAETPFDMQRHAVWNGIMTQVPRYMWIWEHYLELTWTGLFTMPAQYLADEDLAHEPNLDTYNYEVNHTEKVFHILGMASDNKNYYGYLYDPNNGNNISGAQLELKKIPYGNYTISYYLPVSGTIQQTDSVALIKLTNRLDLPEFSKGMAFKIKYLSDYDLPIAIAGNDTVVAPGMSVTFSGIQSISQTSNTVTYSWALDEKPANSMVSLSNTGNEEISVTPDVAGIYKISLVVNDGEQSSVPDVVTITASTPPVAVVPADSSLSIDENYLYIDGTNSYDPDGDDITYSWTLISKPENSKGQLYQMDQPIALLRLDVPGTFEIGLIVNDGISESQQAIFTATIRPTGVESSEIQETINIYPNPSRGLIKIQANGIQLKQIAVYDLSGRLLIEHIPAESSAEFSLNLEAVNKDYGVLLIQLTDQNNQSYNKMIAILP